MRNQLWLTAGCWLLDDYTMTFFAAHKQLVERSDAAADAGCVSELTGLTLVAESLPVPVGSMCRIEPATAEPLDEQVVGFVGPRTLLMPLSDPRGVTAGDSGRLHLGHAAGALGAQAARRVLDAWAGRSTATGPVPRRGQYPVFADPPPAPSPPAD